MAIEKNKVILEDLDTSSGGAKSKVQTRNGQQVRVTPINSETLALTLAQGPAGPAGAAGVGVPAGGATDYALVKTGTADFATGWRDVSNAKSIDLSTAESSWGQNPDRYVPDIVGDPVQLFKLGPSVATGTLPGTGSNEWPTNRSYILQVRVAKRGTSAQNQTEVLQRIEDEEGARLAYRKGTIDSANLANTVNWGQWQLVAGSGGGGGSNLTAEAPIEINNDVISLNATGQNPYYYFQQIKDITGPANASPYPTNQRPVVPATGVGASIPIVPQVNSTGGLLLNRNFETRYEGTINIGLNDTATGTVRVTAVVTHLLSQINAQMTDIVSRRHFDTFFSNQYPLAVPLSNFNSDVTLTSTSDGASLINSVIPIRIDLEIAVFSTPPVDGGTRVADRLKSIEFIECGVTFKQLADKIGPKGDKGDKGDPGDTTSRSFVSLDDTPNNIVAGQFVRGNATGNALEYAVVPTPSANQLLPASGGAAGRYVVDVFMNGQITPEWRDRIIPWTGLSAGNHGNSQGFQIGDIFRYPNTGQNQNIYIVESAIAPGTDFASLAENAVRRITGRGIASVAFNTGTRVLTITRDDGTTETVNIPGGSGGTAFTVPSTEPLELTGTNQLVLNEDDVTLDTTTANSRTVLQVKDAGVGTSKIADSAVTTAKIGADAVDGTKIADNAVGTEHIASRAVTTAKLDNSITQAIDANTAKRSFPADDEAKLDGIAPGATVGATTAQQQAIAANTLKRTYPQADQTKLAGIEVGATVGATTAQALAIAANTAKVSAADNDHTGQPTFASGTLTIPRRTGSAYTVTIPTGSGGGNNIRDILFNTATTIPNAGGTSGWPTGTNLSLQTGKTFADWDVIFIQLEIDSGVSLGGGGVNRFSLVVDGATFRATTSSTRMVQRGSNETTAGYNLGIYNNPNTGETADTSSRFNVAGLGGANARIISIVGAQFRGQTGATGPQGATGQTGPQGNPGTPGQNGAPGADGQDGTAATIAVGTTTTSNPGTNATVTNSGNANAAVFDFAIPRGATGATGPQGATGNTGPQGNPGTPGAAATIAVGTTTTGNPGTSASVTNSGNANQATFDFVIPRGATGAQGATGQTGPQGNPGTNGQDGQDGAAATIAVGTVTTGAAGSNATVTNSGTSSAAVFDFTIPQGAQGIPGTGGGSSTEVEISSGSDADRSYGTTDGITWYVSTTNTPTGVTTGLLRSIRQGTNIGQQLQATVGTNAGKLYVRTSANTGTTWGAWAEISGSGGGGGTGTWTLLKANTASDDLQTARTFTFASLDSDLYEFNIAGTNTASTNAGDTFGDSSKITFQVSGRALNNSSSSNRVHIVVSSDHYRNIQTGSVVYVLVGHEVSLYKSANNQITVKVTGSGQTTGFSNAYLYDVYGYKAGGGSGSGLTPAQAAEIAANTAKVGITTAQAAAIVANTAKVGLYAQHATAVGVWTGVAGNPGDSTVIASGTTQFDSNDVYLSRTTSEGLAISTADLPSAGQPINFAGYPGTVGSISQNSNRIKITINYTGNTPIANDGHKFQLFNVADPSVAEHGVYTKGALEGTGDPADKLDVRDGGITSAKLDVASGDTITAGEAVVYRANGEFGSAPLGQGGGATAFTALTDTPSTYTGQAGRYVRVNTGATGLEFVAESATSSTFARDVLLPSTNISNSQKLNHTVNLASGKVFANHDAILINFKYTHTISFAGHTLSTTNVFSKTYDANEFRAFTGGNQPLEEVYLAGTASNNVKFTIQYSSNTSAVVSFLQSDTAATGATITELEIIGLKYGDATNATTMLGLTIPAFPSS